MSEFATIIEMVDAGANVVICFMGYILFKVERRVMLLETSQQRKN